jgi:phospholipase C
VARRRRPVLVAAAALLAAAATAGGLALSGAFADAPAPPQARTPIKHLVVIFDENISFDHYFATYPDAKNPPHEPAFKAAHGTPAVNGLDGALLADNPSSSAPFRLDRSQAVTCDQDHDYAAEQQAFDHGLMDKFPQFTAGCAPNSIVMGYFDGNTVTALWNYAQHYTMSDNFYDTVFGHSTPGALNLVSGQTHGATPASLPEIVVDGTVINDPDPTSDDCGSGTTVEMSGTNVGDLMNARHVTWGWFQGGFRPTTPAADGRPAQCDASHKNVAGVAYQDYVAHHEPFQYYRSTANPHHLPPSSPRMIGHTDQANHQYDISDFATALRDGNLPQVSFLKAPAYQDAHAGYSDPIDEQHWLVEQINAIERSPEWRSTAIVVTYDDSDGWYDHQMSPILNGSQTSYDALSGPGQCGELKSPISYQGRCGLGPRLPLLVISPYVGVNKVDSRVLEQTSVLKFIEDNWGLGRIGDQSFDERAVSIERLFDFRRGARRAPRVVLNRDGEVTAVGRKVKVSRPRGG